MCLSSLHVVTGQVQKITIQPTSRCAGMTMGACRIREMQLQFWGIDSFPFLIPTRWVMGLGTSFPDYLSVNSQPGWFHPTHSELDSQTDRPFFSILPCFYYTLPPGSLVNLITVPAAGRSAGVGWAGWLAGGGRSPKLTTCEPDIGSPAVQSAHLHIRVIEVTWLTSRAYS